MSVGPKKIALSRGLSSSPPPRSCRPHQPSSSQGGLLPPSSHRTVLVDPHTAPRGTGVQGIGLYSGAGVSTRSYPNGSLNCIWALACRSQSFCHRPSSELKPSFAKCALRSARFTGKLRLSAHHDFLPSYTVRYAVFRFVPSLMRRRAIVRLRFQCRSTIARKRRLMWASNLCSGRCSASVTIQKKPIQPCVYTLSLWMHLRMDCPQFRGVSSRILALMRSTDRFDSNTSTVPSSGSRRRLKPRRCRSSVRATDRQWRYVDFEAVDITLTIRQRLLQAKNLADHREHHADYER